MSINEKNYIKEKLTNLGIDSSEGSAISDLLLTPLNQINSRFADSNKSKIDKFSRLNVDNMNNNDLEFLGSHFLVERLSGIKAFGYVQFYFNTQVNLTLKKDSIVTVGSQRYIIVNTYSIIKSALTYISPYYKTGNIQIQALAEGESYNQNPNTSFEYEGYIEVAPTKVLNSAAITAGVDFENNYDMLDRIKNSIFGTFLGSPTAIETFLKQINTDVESTEIISNEHALMLRDLVYDVTDWTNLHVENFTYVKDGNPLVGYDKEHKAYSGVFKDTNAAVGIDFPTNPSSWSTEFSITGYQSISKEDAIAKSTENLEILDTFTTGGALGSGEYTDNVALISDGWALKDGMTLDNELFRPTDITLRGDALVLGNTKPTDSSYLTYKWVIENIDTLDSGGNPAIIEKWIEDTKKLFTENQSNNASPTLSKQINQHRGIKITTTAMTTDGTDYGSTAYITVMKNDIVYSPYDGYGLAWRKQPAYLIRMQEDNYTDATIEAADRATFLNETGRTDFDDFLGNLTGGTAHAEANEILKYNLYVVDNNLLEDELWIAGSQLWDQTSGKNQFLVASKVWLEENIEYDVTINIGENLGVTAWFGSDPDTEAADITYGPTAPAYIPNAFANVPAPDGEFNRAQFGFGVVNTHNYEWYYKNLEISSTINAFPAHLFKFDMSEYIAGNGATIRYYGNAYDPTNIEAPYNSNLKFALWNDTSSAWEEDSTNWVNTNEPLPYVAADHLIQVDIADLTNYIDTNNNLYYAVIAGNEGDTDHILNTYFTDISDAAYTGVHKGNAIDIYVYDPKKIEIGESDFIVSGSHDIDFTNNNAAAPYICEIMDITESYSGTAIPSTDWVILNDPQQRGLEYSVHNQFKVSFSTTDYNGASLKVRYRYMASGPTLETLINDDSIRQPAVSNMIKAAPLAVINIESLTYSGDVSRAAMIGFIKEYINTLDSSRFEKSDLINLMYEKGATYVDLDMTINIRLYNTAMVATNFELTAQYYNIASDLIAKYYTDQEELYGVVKI